MQPDEENVVMLLDLAIENPIDASIVLTQMPPDRAAAATVLRVTDFGATRSNRGTPQHWPPVIAAIDRMVSQARASERGGARCRYWVAGRAGLPAFFHLGYRLTRQAVVTLVNPRNSGPSDVLWLDRASARPATLPYFVRSSPATQPSLAEVRVSLLVSAMKPIARAQIEPQMSERGVASPVVEAQATGFLDEASIASALRELDDTAAGIRASYPACGALAVFIAGPATLAVLVGRSLNPNIYPDIQVFHQHASAKYELAYETQPAKLAAKKHTILFLASNPAGTNEIALGKEARAIQEEIDRRGDQCRLIFLSRWAAQPLDLLRLLRELKPTIVHFSGHGSEDGLCFQAASGHPQIVSGDAIAMAFGAIEAPVQLVVLNACYSQSQAAVLQAYVPCVIAMSAKIGDRAAHDFAIGLYGGLAHGDSVASAHDQGCAAIALEGSADHNKPRLLVREGIDANAITLA